MRETTDTNYIDQLTCISAFQKLRIELCKHWCVYKYVHVYVHLQVYLPAGDLEEDEKGVMPSS